MHRQAELGLHAGGMVTGVGGSPKDAVLLHEFGHAIQQTLCKARGGLDLDLKQDNEPALAHAVVTLSNTAMQLLEMLASDVWSPGKCKMCLRQKTVSCHVVTHITTLSFVM